jgi:hypothetical protein
MHTPIKATARVPIKQAGYISATSGIQKILSCEQQPVHTFGSTRVESGHDLLKSGHSGNSRDSSGPAPHPPAMGGQMAMASPSSMGRVSRSAGVR